MVIVVILSYYFSALNFTFYHIIAPGINPTALLDWMNGLKLFQPKNMS